MIMVIIKGPLLYGEIICMSAFNTGINKTSFGQKHVNNFSSLTLLFLLLADIPRSPQMLSEKPYGKYRPPPHSIKIIFYKGLRKKEHANYHSIKRRQPQFAPRTFSWRRSRIFYSSVITRGIACLARGLPATGFKCGFNIDTPRGDETREPERAQASGFKPFVAHPVLFM